MMALRLWASRSINSLLRELLVSSDDLHICSQLFEMIAGII